LVSYNWRPQVQTPCYYIVKSIHKNSNNYPVPSWI